MSMDLDHHEAPVFSGVSIASAVLAVITIKDAQVFLGIIASLVAIGSGVMAIRYYHFSTKVKKKQLKDGTQD